MMRVRRTAGPAVLAAGLLSTLVEVQGATNSLPFTNAGVALLSVVKDYALSSQFTMVPSTTSNDLKRFFGVFTPFTNTSKLAIHSDDGSDVFINNNPVWLKRGTGTSLDNENSFHEITGPDTNGTPFVAGQHYCVEITYSNMAYTANDKDGVTLYAFHGGGSVQDNLPVDGPDFVCVGGSITLSTCPAYGSADWSSSAPGIASIVGNQSSGYVQGLAPGTVTITASNGYYGRTGSRVVKVAPLSIDPASFFKCVGEPVTFVVTNPVTSGVWWDPAGTVSANTRTNTLSFSAAGTTNVTASWNDCPTASATGVVVAVASLTASTNLLCGSGNVTFTATTSPPGYESILTWNPNLTTLNSTQRVGSYSASGVYPVVVSCGTSARTNTITVHKVDITNATEYALAGGSGASFGLSADSLGPFTWEVTPTGPTVNGNGASVTIYGSTPGAFTVKCSATPLPSCSDTATLQVVQVTFSSVNPTLCEGASSNLAFTVNPSSALSLLTFDTVTNAAAGGIDTHAHVTVNGTNLTLHGDLAGTVLLRVKIGSSVRVGAVATVVRVTFPTNDWYVGVAGSASYPVTVIPTNAAITFDTVSNSIATATAASGGVQLSGVAPGVTQVRAFVGGGAPCAMKTVTAVRATFSTNRVVLCTGNSRAVSCAVDPPGSPVVFTQSTLGLQMSVQGTNVTVTPQTNLVATVMAKVGSQLLNWFSVESLTVRFPSNAWYAAPGGHQSFTVEVEPADLAPHVNFMSLNTNVATVTAGSTPRELVIHGVSNVTATITAWVGTTNQWCHSKVVTIVTPTITSVQWIQTGGGPITSNNLNPGGGLMFYPDSPLPGLGPSNRISIRATVSPPVSFSNAVHFRVFDVDDPTTTNVVIDNENDAFDNKGSHTPPTSSAVSTDTNGMAEVTMTLSMQPGDNFRAVAAATAAFFNDVGARQNDGVNMSVTNSFGALPGTQITPPLSIWRKLHVEVDSMSRVVSNEVRGSIVGIAGIPSAATNLTLSVNLRTGLTPQDDSPNLSTGTNRGRFENGWIRVGTNQAMTGSIHGNGDTFVMNPSGFSIPADIVAGGGSVNAGQVVALAGNVFTVSGDLSAGSFAGGSLRVAGTPFAISGNTTNTVTVAGTAQVPFVLHDDDNDDLLPRLVWPLPDPYAAAFITLAPVDTSTQDTNLPFVLNLGSDLSAVTNGFDLFPFGRDSYWVVYLLSAYQFLPYVASIPAGDGDSNSESGVGGFAVGADVTGGTGGFGAFIYVETVRDRLANSGADPGLEARVATHELGHVLGLPHNTQGGVMWPTVQQANPNGLPFIFLANELNHLRSRVRSPGR